MEKILQEIWEWPTAKIEKPINWASQVAVDILWTMHLIQSESIMGDSC